MSKKFYVECVDSETDEITENLFFFADTEDFTKDVMVEFISQCFKKEED